MSKAIFTSTCLPGSVKENVKETEMVARLETDSPIITCRVTGTVSCLLFRTARRSEVEGDGASVALVGFSSLESGLLYETHEIRKSQFGNPSADLTQRHGGFQKKKPALHFWVQKFSFSAMQATTAASGGTIAAAVAAGIVDVTAADAPEPAALSSL